VTHDQVEAMTMGDRVAVMRHGVLQQFDVPQRLYESPANLFVASFIGSPSMNVVEATVEKTAGAIALRVGSATLPLPAETVSARPALAGYAGRRIALGIRPEALDETTRRNGDETGRLRGITRAVEALGPELLVYLEVQAKPVLADEVLEGLVDEAEQQELAEILPDSEGTWAMMVARLDASASVRPDDTIDLAVDLRKLHFFDLDNGQAIVS
jgi:multiple sugar transport system ATP-binding protein